MSKAKAIIPLIALMVGVASCLDGADIAKGDCVPFVRGHLDSNGDLDPCCTDKTSPCPGAVTQTVPDKCDGACMSVGPPDNWQRLPLMLWHGSSSEPLPTCPDNASAFAWLGRDPILPLTCPLCECSDPACVLPDGLIADAVAGCALPGPFTPFHPEPNGSCSKQASFDPNDVQSVAIMPPTVTACVGSMVPVSKDITLSSWSTRAVLCAGNGVGECDDPHNQVCLPAAPQGFTQCVMGNTPGRTHDTCPPEYPHKHVYYRDIDFKASCSPCDCSPPVGSICEAEVTAYKTETCASNDMFLTVTVNPSPGPPPCYTVQPNTALRGLTEKWVVNQPGKCDPVQSVPKGIAKPLESSAWEFCCADPDFPDPGPPVP